MNSVNIRRRRHINTLHSPAPTKRLSAVELTLRNRSGAVSEGRARGCQDHRQQKYDSDLVPGHQTGHILSLFLRPRCAERVQAQRSVTPDEMPTNTTAYPRGEKRGGAVCAGHCYHSIHRSECRSCLALQCTQVESCSLG